MSSSRHVTEAQQETGPVVLLSFRYPISHRTLVKKTFPWLLGFAASLLLLCGLVSSQGGIHDEEELGMSLHDAAGALTLLIGVVLLVRVAYEMLYRYCYYYAIEAGHLVISKGILLKQRGSFPLSRITDIYLDRSLSDFVLGLCDLHVSTPTVHSGRFARIDGLTLSTAVALQEHLTSLLEAMEANHLTAEQMRFARGGHKQAAAGTEVSVLRALPGRSRSG